MSRRRDDDLPWDRAPSHDRDRRLVELLGPDSTVKSRRGDAERTRPMSRPSSRTSLRDLLGGDDGEAPARDRGRGRGRGGGAADLDDLLGGGGQRSEESSQRGR